MTDRTRYEANRRDEDGTEMRICSYEKNDFERTLRKSTVEGGRDE